MPWVYISFNRTYAVAHQAGGLEGCKPSKNDPFLVICAGKAGTYHQKDRDLGEAGYPLGASPNPSIA
jgi:hypothetical protein